MNLAPMLRQSVSWEVANDPDNRGDRTYAEATTVPGRTCPTMRDIIGTNGEVVTVTQQVLLLVEPAIKDKLNGREVVVVAPLVDYAGVTPGYRALTR